MQAFFKCKCGKVSKFHCQFKKEFQYFKTRAVCIQCIFVCKNDSHSPKVLEFGPEIVSFNSCDTAAMASI